MTITRLSPMSGNWLLLAAALSGVASILIARECLARVVEYEELLRSTTDSRDRAHDQLSRFDTVELDSWEE